MTLVSDIIRDAYRESNLIAVNASPTTAEVDEGLRLLNRIIDSVYGFEAGEDYHEIIIGRNDIERPSGFPWYSQVPDTVDWFVPDNARLILNLTSPQDLYLTPTPQDGTRFSFIDVSGNLSSNNVVIYGNGRLIEGQDSVTVSVDGANQEYFYRADLGNWVRVSPLVESDDFPFPGKFEDLFVILLSMRINPRHGAEVDPQSGAELSRLLRSFKAKYRQSQEVGSEPALVWTPGVKRRGSWDTARANAEFMSGYPFSRYWRW